jgi:hypothetical protein
MHPDMAAALPNDLIADLFKALYGLIAGNDG